MFLPEPLEHCFQNHTSLHSECAKLGHNTCVGSWALASTARVHVSQAVVDVCMPSLTDAEQQRIARFVRSSQTFSPVGGHTAEPCAPSVMLSIPSFRIHVVVAAEQVHSLAIEERSQLTVRSSFCRLSMCWLAWALLFSGSSGKSTVTRRAPG